MIAGSQRPFHVWSEPAQETKPAPPSLARRSGFNFVTLSSQLSSFLRAAAKAMGHSMIALRLERTVQRRKGQCKSWASKGPASHHSSLCSHQPPSHSQRAMHSNLTPQQPMLASATLAFTAGQRRCLLCWKHSWQAWQVGPGSSGAGREAGQSSA